MSWFRVEVLGVNGKMIEVKHVDLPCHTVGQALNSSVVNKIKKEAKFQGMGFRVKLEEDV
jgi:hypothetical protein